MIILTERKVYGQLNISKDDPASTLTVKLEKRRLKK
jgi:hypothetical protein